jgi:hypothetical protein
MAARPECDSQRLVDPADVTGVRHDDDRAAAARDRSRHGRGDLRRPVTREHQPASPRRCPSQLFEQRSPIRITVEGVTRRRFDITLVTTPSGFLSSGMARWNRESDHVRERTRPPVRNSPAQRRDLVREHRLTAEHPLDVRQPTAVLALGEPFQHERVDQLSREPHSAPNPRLRRNRLRLGHQIVESPIQMR